MQQLYAFTANESTLWFIQYFASGPQIFLFLVMDTIRLQSDHVSMETLILVNSRLCF